MRPTFVLSVLLLCSVIGQSAPVEWDRERAVLEEHRIPHGPLPESHHTHASTITEAADGTSVSYTHLPLPTTPYV